MAHPEKLFNIKDEKILKPDQTFVRVRIITTADGGYADNGEYESPEDQIYSPNGFDKGAKGEEPIWYSPAFIIREKS